MILLQSRFRPVLDFFSRELEINKQDDNGNVITGLRCNRVKFCGIPAECRETFECARVLIGAEEVQREEEGPPDNIIENL